MKFKWRVSVLDEQKVNFKQKVNFEKQQEEYDKT